MNMFSLTGPVLEDETCLTMYILILWIILAVSVLSLQVREPYPT
jgi:hypothetical protein